MCSSDTGSENGRLQVPTSPALATPHKRITKLAIDREFLLLARHTVTTHHTQPSLVWSNNNIPAGPGQAAWQYTRAVYPVNSRILLKPYTGSGYGALLLYPAIYTLEIESRFPDNDDEDTSCTMHKSNRSVFSVSVDSQSCVVG